MYFNPVVFKGIFVQLGLLPSSNMHACKHGLRSGHQKLDPRNGSTNTQDIPNMARCTKHEIGSYSSRLYIYTPNIIQNF